MTQKLKIDFKEISKTKKVLVIVFIAVFLFWGIITGIIAIAKFENYNRPYLFGFCFGTIGLVIGIIVSNRLKPYLIINSKMQEDYFKIVMYISTGFIGSMMLLGHFFNSSISTIDKSENCYVVDKIYREGRYRKAELNILVINFEGEYHRLLCRHNYWQKIMVGDKVNICFYKSKIGFDYITLIDDK